jgi:anti-sigma factor RsiW
MSRAEFELMDGYMMNELSDDDKQRFEARLAADKTFAREYAEHKVMFDTLKRYLKTRETLKATRAALEAKGFFEQVRSEDPPVAVEVGSARRERPWYVYAFWTVLALIIMLLLVFFADLIRHVLS